MNITRVGLNGIDVFDLTGAPIVPDKITSSDSQSDISNITNGIYLAEREDEMWVTDHSLSKRNIEIEIDFGKPYIVSMVRFWNYCTGKHTWKKGVRHLGIELDQVVVFCGEVSSSTGGKYLTSRYDQILYTENEDILMEISKKDWLYPMLEKEDNAIDEIALKEVKAGGVSVRLEPGLSARERTDFSNAKVSARE